MRTMVRFVAGGATYCLPVEVTRAVRSSAGMVTLPAPNPNVAGLLPGDPPLTVVSPFGGDGDHILVLHVGEVTYGLLVDSVTGLQRVEEADIRPAPRGQQRDLVSGSVTIDGELVLLTDGSAAGVGAGV
jgi:chemotaxis signal transduction protein